MSTIITDQSYTASGSSYSMTDAAYQQMEYEQRKWTVECAIETCGEIETDTQQALEREGWQLTSNGEFCYRHQL